MLESLLGMMSAEEIQAYKLHEGNFIPLRDLLVALDAHGLKQPSQELDQLRDRLDRLGGLQIGALLKGGGGWANQVETSRLAIGKLLSEILDRLETRAARHRHDPSLYLLSAHDTSIVPLLTALGVYDGNWPPYASYISFELWEEGPTDKSEHPQFSVRILFNGKPVPVPRCRSNEFDRTSLEDVRRGLKPVLPKNLHQECVSFKAPHAKATHKRAGEVNTSKGGDKF